MTANLELETYGLEVSGDRTAMSFTTKKDHKKVVGVFITAVGTDDLKDSSLNLRLDSKNIVGYGDFQAKIIQATDNLSYKDVMWDLDVEINSSSFDVVFQNRTGNTGFWLFVHLVCVSKS